MKIYKMNEYRSNNKKKFKTFLKDLIKSQTKQNTDTYLFLRRDNDRSFANTSLNIMRVYNTYISSTHTRLLNKEQRIAHLCSSPD